MEREGISRADACPGKIRDSRYPANFFCGLSISVRAGTMGEGQARSLRYSLKLNNNILQNSYSRYPMTLVCECMCARTSMNGRKWNRRGCVWPYVAEGTCFHSSCNLLYVRYEWESLDHVVDIRICFDARFNFVRLLFLFCDQKLSYLDLFICFRRRRKMINWIVCNTF